MIIRHKHFLTTRLYPTGSNEEGNAALKVDYMLVIICTHILLVYMSCGKVFPTHGL